MLRDVCKLMSIYVDHHTEIYVYIYQTITKFIGLILTTVLQRKVTKSFTLECHPKFNVSGEGYQIVMRFLRNGKPANLTWRFHMAQSRQTWDCVYVPVVGVRSRQSLKPIHLFWLLYRHPVICTQLIQAALVSLKNTAFTVLVSSPSLFWLSDSKLHCTCGHQETVFSIHVYSITDFGLQFFLQAAYISMHTIKLNAQTWIGLIFTERWNGKKWFL